MANDLGQQIEQKPLILNRSVSVIQIGDIHLPDFRDSRILDVQDSGFPSDLLRHIAPTRLERVVAKIIKVVERVNSTRPCGVLIVGDLTSKGDVTAYGECVEYLCKALRLGNSNFWVNDQVHIVPGNHDIDRKKIDSEADIYQKFQSLHDCWNANNLAILTNQSARHTKIEQHGCHLDVFSINSCLGCGAKQYLPGSLRDQLDTLLRSSDFEVNGMQLDTPAFDDKALNSITEGIESLTATTLPIVLSHHNILPQAEPRIEIYTEPINGGLVRSRLSQLNRPVLYCHGHLHKDPVEIINSPRIGIGRLVCISAPLLSDGFNIIEIDYARSGVPIGCVLRGYRLKGDGSVKPEPDLRIPLWGQRDHMFFSENSLSSCILDHVKKDGQRFKTIFDLVGKLPDVVLTEQDFVDCLKELEWAGMISITDRQHDTRHWQISRMEL